MHAIFAIVIFGLTACTIALPPGVPDERNGAEMFGPRNAQSYDGQLQRFLRSQYIPTIDRIPNKPRPQPQPTTDWLDKEIERITKMKETGPGVVPFRPEFINWKNNEPYNRIMLGSSRTQESHDRMPRYDYPNWPTKPVMSPGAFPHKHPKVIFRATTAKVNILNPKMHTKVFAFTPTDAGYYEGTEKHTSQLPNMMEGPHEGGGHQELLELNPKRESRQNPFGRRKTLIADEVGKLKDALDSDPDKPDHIRVLGTQYPTGTVYTVGIAMGVGTAILLAVIGFIFGWYAISKRAKAAADVDYPAYGVTGPTMDTSGDRKLAHSAQMYHYQHQKQQIIAMERTHPDQCTGSVSEPESEDENGEGDYTVYECPGFATTGVMEVRNPMFIDEATPASPGKTEEVKPEPKE